MLGGCAVWLLIANVMQMLGGFYSIDRWLPWPLWVVIKNVCVVAGL